MIKYNSGSFGFQLLLRLHGSAVFKSLTPALLSSAIYLILHFTTDLEDDEDQIIEHPYTIGALIAALTFLLAFRANFSYNRYWEAMTAVHQMHSKWLDVGMELAAFHLQSTAYDKRKPPAFGQHPEIKSVERERERLNELTLDEFKEKLEALDQSEIGIHGIPMEQSLRTRVSSIFKRKPVTNTTDLVNASSSADESDNAVLSSRTEATRKTSNARSINAVSSSQQNNGRVVRFLRLINRDKPENTAETQLKVSTAKKKTKIWEEGKPPLVLQEGAHLLSLLSAVAFSTLRNDLEQADSPLTTFVPGAPWPHVDPDAYSADVRKDWSSSTHRSWTVLRYLLGTSRNLKARTLYNAARPFRVVGSVSDSEIELLQAARGPLAKVALCSMWLQEFCTREHLNGSTGKVAPPIISRLYQFTSDGMVGYNQARKIAYIPFPFPHAQITSLFVLVVCGFMPVLMLSFITNEIFGFILNLLTVMCFTGLHEVARELENPFQNVPNDVPLNNFQAQFNESLMNMFTGYHPDAYWEVKEEEVPAIDEMMTNSDEPQDTTEMDESNNKKE